MQQKAINASGASSHQLLGEPLAETCQQLLQRQPVSLTHVLKVGISAVLLAVVSIILVVEMSVVREAKDLMTLLI